MGWVAAYRRYLMGNIHTHRRERFGCRSGFG